MFGVIAHFEQRLISEGAKDEIAAAPATGKLPGRRPLNMTKVDTAIGRLRHGCHLRNQLGSWTPAITEVSWTR